MATPPSNLRQGPNGKLIFPGTDSSALNPLTNARSVKRGGSHNYAQRHQNNIVVPTGYTTSTISGTQFTYNGLPVFDNSPSTPLSVRT